ncbi:Cysteine dioxygenase [Aphanomyces cochlioides]|nr:Cysteine dioxygenase [Aphanomyces cochlioides]
MRHFQGPVKDVRYWNDGVKLVETTNMLITEGVTYMNDSLGLNKIGNPSDDIDAVMLSFMSSVARPFNAARPILTWATNRAIYLAADNQPQL